LVGEGWDLVVLRQGEASQMEMKPEYSYGSYMIADIQLLRKNLGDAPARVLYVLRKLYPQSHYKSMTLQNFVGGNAEETIISWRLSNQSDIDFLKEQFQWAKAKLDVCETHISLANINEPVLSYRLDDRLPFGGYARLPSEDLSRMQEYAFDIWAKENKLLEAYRYFLFPALGESEVIRVWRTENGGYGIYKIGNLGFCIKSAAKETSFEIAPEVWQDFEAFIEKFWKDESWKNNLENTYTDGYSLYFEGWRQGNYKKLSATNATDAQSSALQAAKAFRELIPNG
jgi:hypothetical protein